MIPEFLSDITTDLPQYELRNIVIAIEEKLGLWSEHSLFAGAGQAIFTFRGSQYTVTESYETVTSIMKGK